METVVAPALDEYVAKDALGKTKAFEPWESIGKQSLIPGLPDEITINHILTRLPWGIVSALASLGRAWQASLRSRDIYEARVRAGSIESFVAMVHDDPTQTFRNIRCALSLYDFGRGSWRLLPQIPGIRCGIPDGCGCVSMHGKLYIIGGRGDAPVHFSNEVHEFDLAGMAQWRRCADMRSGRAVFASDVNDGKIYVFGGMGAESAAEVYDPELDAWHEIAPMLSNRIQHKVVHVGTEFYVHMGKYFSAARHWNDAHFAEVYDSVENIWRKVENFTGNNPVSAQVAEALVVIYGRIFKILDDRLCVYDGLQSTWLGPVQLILWDGVRSRSGHCNLTSQGALAASAIFVQGELLALVCCRNPDNEVVLNPLRSVGFGRRRHPLRWKEIPSSLHFRQCHCMCPIEL